ncbi:hypothetical protein MYCTH_2130620 [Thermothelomyces thermophilus ATCC 42464]|uniref:NWD NACHT-NTPase N-terminal domain-containing protein n=1 Tax=Thermothelomyces thermophilus (strain ATCC 42464 / BCRC 31852 / DSM 1799) TaxID=573729 RepID=G2QPE3_THET4|nr:uncharacterized protein MYCTH_2130620 [Thermothelomyces thermophilus ATCC 42464]AEO61456.1 hypothetical protein MYCTH_2130620 [Thermothelomyces thermophilus ATCC 42464]
MGLREKFGQKFGHSTDKVGATQTSALSRGNKAESGSQALDDTPIRKLWDLAYDKLREEEEGAILEYEKKLQRKMDEVNRDSWKLRFGSNEVLVKDLAEPVSGIISRANDYIIGAVITSNPYAATAWTGVALLLPLLLNPSMQAASLARGLEYISSLISQSRMWEELYEMTAG